MNLLKELSTIKVIICILTLVIYIKNFKLKREIHIFKNCNHNLEEKYKKLKFDYDNLKQEKKRKTSIKIEKNIKAFDEILESKIISARVFHKYRKCIWDSELERKIYICINKILNNRLVILPHISLAELFVNISKDEKMKENGNKNLAYYHVDFLICSKDNLKPLIALEVDGKTHYDEKQKVCDAFKDELFLNAKMQLIRITTDELLESDMTKVLSQKLRQALNEPVLCEVCGKPMVKRESRNNDEFLGCSSYPNCKNTKNSQFKWI